MLHLALLTYPQLYAAKQLCIGIINISVYLAVGGHKTLINRITILFDKGVIKSSVIVYKKVTRPYSIIVIQLDSAVMLQKSLH